MFYGLVAPGSDVTGSIMLTASHMPMPNNGLKFFTAEGGLSKPDITALLEGAVARCAAAGVPLGDPMLDPGHVLRAAVDTPAAPATWPLLSLYAAHLREQIVAGIRHPTHPDAPLTGLKIAVDAGNGSGGFFATQVLAPLGADVSGSQFLDPDGTFPNHIPNPENKAAMAAAVDAVKRSGADLGIVFDTDVDRSAIVDGDGTPINSNRFIALMAAIVLQEHPGSTVVTDSVTSNGLTAFIEARGGKHFRFKRGYKNVISKGMELNAQGGDCELMMETSGHGAMRSNRYLDDGSHLALTAVVAFVRSRLASGGEGGLRELLADLQEPKEEAEHRISIKDADFKPVGAEVLSAFNAWVAGGAGGADGWSLEPVNHEGWRVNIDEGGGRRGWALLRQSLHDPLLVLNIESDTVGGVSTIRKHLLAFLHGSGAAGKLDLGGLAEAH
ncbi:algC [Scenedesmus sp. PABB004]|nr:algC [Scenedesmus sp. PABB004]